MKLIIRSHCHANFTIIPNATLRDNSLSLKARGLLALALSNRDDWQMTKEWVCENVPEGRQAISGAFRELRKAGYLTKQIVKDPVTGKVDTTVWIFSDTPAPPEQRDRLAENPTDGKPNDGNPTVGFPPTKNTIERRRPSEEEQKDRQSPPDSAGSSEADGLEDSDRTEDSDLSKRRKKSPPDSLFSPPPLPGVGSDGGPNPQNGAAVEPDRVAVASKAPGVGRKTPKRPKEPADPRHKLLIDTFAQRFEEHFQVKYLFQGAKDAVAVKALLTATEGMTVDDVMAVIRFGWTHRDSFIRSASTTLARIPGIWNQMRSQMPRPSPIPGGGSW